MAAFVHSPQGRAVLALPRQDVVFIQGAITPSGHYSQPLQGYGYSPARSSRGLGIPASRW